MNKLRKKLIFLIPPLMATAGSGAYFAVSLAKKSDTPLVNKNPVEKQVKSEKVATKGIFPQLNRSDFYKYIRINEQNAYISDDMIARIVNYIILKLQFSNGDLRWGYQFTDDTKKAVLLRFELMYPTSWNKDNDTFEYYISVAEN